MLRLFAAIALPDEIAAALLPLQRAVPGAKWSPRENFHVTLRFMGAVDEPTAEELDMALARAQVAPFALRLGRAGFFGGTQPHALFVHADGGDPLSVLRGRAERACRDCGLEPDRRAYTPHATLAYLGRDVDPARVHAWERAHALFEAGPWTVDRFFLWSSHSGDGPSRYRLEAEYPLTG
jgi:RNA 2',3'-cyclic 3'-phosphodiesterase